MSEQNSKASIWNEWPFKIGLLLTVFIVVLFAYLLVSFPVLEQPRNFPTKWIYLKFSAPNEIGDTLAGVAGSLAFVWLVVTVILQAKELREQRQEFKKMADAQTKQIELLELQSEIFKEEQIQRRQSHAREQALEIISIFRKTLIEIHAFPIRIDIENSSSMEFRVIDQIKKEYSSGKKVSEESEAVLLNNILEALAIFVGGDKGKQKIIRSTALSKLKDQLVALNSYLAEANPSLQLKLSFAELKSGENFLREYMEVQ